MKHTILHIAKYYYPTEGGIETVTKYMAEGLTDYNNIVICFNESCKTRTDVVGHVKVYRIASSLRIASQDIAPSYYWHLKKIIQLHQPDIIIVHCPNPFLYPITSRLVPSNTKLVLLWHSDILGKGILYRLVNRFEQTLLRKADMILATSPNYIHPSSPIYAYKDKIEVLQNGIIEEAFKPTENTNETVRLIKERHGNKKIVFFVGRHAKYKGIDYLIQAEKYIKSDCIILIGGKGSETESLKSMVHSDRIKFIGKVPDEELGNYYRASDVFGFSSFTKQEAFGIALAEAMYCGCVPVTFTIEGSGVNWLSVGGVTGEEVRLGDVKAYAEAIDRILSTPALYEKYKKAGKERISNMFTSDRSNAKAKEIFEKLLQA